MNYKLRIVLVGAIGTLCSAWSYYNGKHAADRWYASHPVIKTIEVKEAAPIVESTEVASDFTWPDASGVIGRALWAGEGWVCWPFGASCSVSGDEVKYSIPPPIGAYACIDLDTKKTHRCTKKDIPKDYFRAVQR